MRIYQDVRPLVVVASRLVSHQFELLTASHANDPRTCQGVCINDEVDVPLLHIVINTFTTTTLVYNP